MSMMRYCSLKASEQLFSYIMAWTN